jgi:MSHA biogenesis protein MshO
MRRTQLPSIRRYGGFTMVELVVSMVIATILAGFVGLTMTTPVEAYLAQARRSELSDSAETAVRSLARDVRGALPESLRPGVVGGSEALEMIEVSAVAGYRVWESGDPLDIDQSDSSFDAAGALLTGRRLNRLVVGASRANPTYDPYLNTAVITPVGPPISFDPANQSFTLPAPHRFPRGSTNQRAYAVVGTIRYVCDTVAGVLRRYENLAIQPAMDPIAGGTIVARDIAACTFRTQSSAAEHGGIAIVEITVSRATGGNTEGLRVMRQLRVENPP